MRKGDTEKLGIQKNKPLGYAYAFHSEGLPMVFWREYFDFAYLYNDGSEGPNSKIQDEINRLITIRQVAVGGELTVLHADEDVYAQEREGGLTADFDE